MAPKSKPKQIMKKKPKQIMKKKPAPKSKPKQIMKKKPSIAQKPMIQDIQNDDVPSETSYTVNKAFKIALSKDDCPAAVKENVSRIMALGTARTSRVC